MKTRPRWMVARDVKEEESLWFRGGANLGFDFDFDNDDGESDLDLDSAIVSLFVLKVIQRPACDDDVKYQLKSDPFI